MSLASKRSLLAARPPGYKIVQEATRHDSFTEACVADPHGYV
jgi:hypothetical protein